MFSKVQAEKAAVVREFFTGSKAEKSNRYDLVIAAQPYNEIMVELRDKEDAVLAYRKFSFETDFKSNVEHQFTLG